jgi:hypothetical protein
LKRVERVGVLNIQPLAVSSSLHLPSSSQCEEGKANNEKMQFADTIIQDIYKIETSIIEFLCRHRRGWSSSEQAGPRATLADLVHIEESEEDEGVE